MAETVGDVGAHTGKDVLVGGHGEAWVGVAESLGYDFDRDAGSDEQRCVRVAPHAPKDEYLADYIGEVAGDAAV